MRTVFRKHTVSGVMKETAYLILQMARVSIASWDTKYTEIRINVRFVFFGNFLIFPENGFPLRDR